MADSLDKQVLAQAVQSHILPIFRREDLDAHLRLLLQEYTRTQSRIMYHPDQLTTLREALDDVYEGYGIGGEKKIGFKYYIVGAKAAATWDRVRAVIELAGITIPAIGLGGSVTLEIADIIPKTAFIELYRMRTGDIQGVKSFWEKEVTSIIPLLGPVRELMIHQGENRGGQYKGFYLDRARYWFRKEANELYWSRAPEVVTPTQDDRQEMLRRKYLLPAAD